jgi:parallel beta-helix repeat protein
MDVIEKKKNKKHKKKIGEREMTQGKGGSFAIIMAMIIAMGGLGLGGISYFYPQEGQEGVAGIDGTDGIDGIDGIDGMNGTDGIEGQDLTGSIAVGVLDPDHEDTIKGDIVVRGLVFGTDNYSVAIVINGSVNGTELPFLWETGDWDDGLWNLTIVITDLDTNEIANDSVLVSIRNYDYELIYHCSSYDEIIEAVDAMGYGSGTIVISGLMMIPSTINLNGGGFYTIKGSTEGTYLINTDDFSIFSVSGGSSCIFEDLLLLDMYDTLTASTSFIKVTLSRNLLIDNLLFEGMGQGRGLDIDSASTVTITDSRFYKLNYGIITDVDATITQNEIDDCINSGITCYDNDNFISNNKITYCEVAIDLRGDRNVISENIIRGAGTADIGIYTSSTSDDNIISNNQITDFRNGILIYGGDYNIISGNNIRTNIFYDDVSNCSGIEVNSGIYNSITGNTINLYVNIDVTGVGMGICLASPSCFRNLIDGNILNDCEDPIFDGGSSTTVGLNIEVYI